MTFHHPLFRAALWLACSAASAAHAAAPDAAPAGRTGPAILVGDGEFGSDPSG